MMNEKSKELLSSMSLNKGLSQKEIESFIKEIHYNLPKDYIEFLTYSNGAWGEVGNGYYVDLWTIEEIKTENEAIEISKYAPGLIAFASDGANELYAFDVRIKEMPIVNIPLIGMSLESIIFYAENFDNFLDKLASSEF